MLRSVWSDCVVRACVPGAWAGGGGCGAAGRANRRGNKGALSSAAASTAAGRTVLSSFVFMVILQFRQKRLHGLERETRDFLHALGYCSPPLLRGGGFFVFWLPLGEQSP